jgi:hypothetical protein
LTLESSKFQYLHGQSHVVLRSRQPQLRVHAGDLSVGDVAAVEERQEIKYREGRDQSEVDFAKDAFRLLRIEDLFLLSCRQ